MNTPPFVVQFCASLNRPCGIASYTHMLAEAQRMPAVSSLQELEKYPCMLVHVQHEFGMMSLRELREVHRYCSQHGLRWFITMHTVLPLPSFIRYCWYRISLRNLSDGIRSALTIILLRPFEWLLIRINVLLRGNLRLWKRWNCLKNSLSKHQLVHTEPSAKRLFHWTEDNPTYGLRDFFRFRATQRFIIRHADCIVVHLTAAKEVLVRQGATKIEVVPHGIQIFPVSSELLSQRDGKLHIGCFGHLHQNRGISCIIEACSEIPEVQLHIFASVAINPQAAEYLQQLSLAMSDKPWISLETEHLPLYEIVFRLSQCDRNVWYCDPPGAISASGSICQYIAARRPVIASETIMVSDLHDILTFVSPGYPAALRNAIVLSLKEKNNHPDFQKILEERSFDRCRPRYACLDDLTRGN